MPKKLNSRILVFPFFIFFVLLINSAYLSYKYIEFYYLGGFMDVNCADGCDSVMTSKYAMIFNVPTPLWGFAFFFFLFILFILLLKEKSLPIYSKSDRKLRHNLDFLFGFSLLLASVVATAFLYIMYFELEAMCKFCTLSHICTYALTLYYFFVFKRA